MEFATASEFYARFYPYCIPEYLRRVDHVCCTVCDTVVHAYDAYVQFLLNSRCEVVAASWACPSCAVGDD